MSTPKKARAKLSAILREQVWLEYIGDKLYGKCFCCQSAQISILRNTEFAHVVPVARGGQDTVENLRPCCESCNRSMGTMNLMDYMERLRKSGVIPTPRETQEMRDLAQDSTHAQVGAACAQICAREPEPMEVIEIPRGSREVTRRKANPWIL